jgi:ParB-like chromosome segregation protein Spo0J
MDTSIQVSSIKIENRIRKDLGDIKALAKSIEENGLIEPIVLANGESGIRLVAGERRLTALKSLGLQSLEHAKHFIWREELRSQDPKIKLLAASIEMEENIRRKDLTWPEVIAGKQKLLSIMQELYGPPRQGPPTKAESMGLQKPGFGVRKLAEMLGEAESQTSQDLELAALVEKLPALKSEPSREAAKRRLELAVKTATGQASPHVASALSYRIVIFCDDEQHQKTLLGQLRTAGLKCQPIVA